MRTTADLRRMWKPACEGRTKVLLLHSGAKIRINESTAEAFRAIDTIMQAADYAPRVRDTGGFVCRAITGGKGYSLHAFGIAVDYNWNSNPYRSDGKLITDMPKAMVAAIKAIRTRDGVTVFRWGGDYRTAKDAMHFEVVASPRELAAGIDWPSIGLKEPDAADPRSWPVLEQGDKGPTVRQLQKRLTAAGFVCEEDGIFGAATARAVTAYQASRALDVDGAVGRQTWTALLTDQPPVPEGASPVKVGPRQAQDDGRPPATCRRGSKGKNVTRLQDLLVTCGFDCGGTDGRFGGKTEEAVKAFQRARGLEVDGIVGKATWQALLAG